MCGPQHVADLCHRPYTMRQVHKSGAPLPGLSNSGICPARHEREQMAILLAARWRCSVCLARARRSQHLSCRQSSACNSPNSSRPTNCKMSNRSGRVSVYRANKAASGRACLGLLGLRLPKHGKPRAHLWRSCRPPQHPLLSLRAPLGQALERGGPQLHSSQVRADGERRFLTRYRSSSGHKAGDCL